MAFNVTEFRSNMIGDGARPNLFNVTLILPPFVSNSAGSSKQISFMAKAAQLPGSSVGTVPVYYFGRELKFAGNRTFPDWTLQIINDENFSIRNSLENWLNSINSHEGNLRSGNSLSPASYSIDATVSQYGKTGNVLKEYKFVGMFPIDVAPIDLDWGSNDTIEEYSVTFAYQYWTAETTN